MLLAHKELATKLAQLERRIGSHDQAIDGILYVIRELMTPPSPSPKKRQTGFIQ